jgi:hypothetical protein
MNVIRSRNAADMQPNHNSHKADKRDTYTTWILCSESSTFTETNDTFQFHKVASKVEFKMWSNIRFN